MDEKSLILPLLSEAVFLLPSVMSECMSLRDEVAAYSWSGSLFKFLNRSFK